MQYRTLLKESTGCPFCTKEAFDPIVLVTENRRARVTVAKAPYVPDQLLIIPKRHVVNFLDLTFLESIDCFRLIRWAGKQLYRKGHSGYTILLRDGTGVGKSVDHLHIHIIPSLDIDIKNGSRRRRVLTKTEIKKTVKEILK